MSELSDSLDVFFKDLEPEERSRLLAGQGLWKCVQFKKGDVIFSEGSNSNELYLLLQGTVKIAKDLESADYKVKELAVLTSGSMFGEGALLSDKPRSASAVANEAVEALQLSEEDFDLFVEKNPADAAFLLLGLMKVVNQRLQWTNHELVTLYDVARIVHESGDDSETLLKNIAEKLEFVTHAPRGLISFENRSTQLESVMINWGNFSLETDVLEGFELQLEGKNYSVDSGQLVVAIRDLSRNLLGLMVMEKTVEWSLEMIKMVVSIAEQIGIVIGDYKFMALERDRSTMEKQKTRVNF